MANKKLKPKKTYKVDIDFYSMELNVVARNAVEARKLAKNKIAGKIKSHINNMYLNIEQSL